jgi:hypothetical protein
MDPVTLALLVSAGTAAAKTGIGIGQAAKGRKLAKSAVRPAYQIPSSVEDYLKNASAMAQTSTLPGQQLMEEKLSASTGAGIRSAEQGASSSAGLMATIAGLKGAEQEKLTDIGIAGAQYQDANKQRLQEALLKYGQFEDKAFDVNQMAPFYEKTEAAQAMTGAGMQNIMTGIEGLGGAASIAGTEGLFGKKAAGDKAAQTKFGMSTSEQRLGSPTGLTEQSNVQKYISARKKGFTGTYDEWAAKQPLGF